MRARLIVVASVAVGISLPACVRYGWSDGSGARLGSADATDYLPSSPDGDVSASDAGRAEGAVTGADGPLPSDTFVDSLALDATVDAVVVAPAFLAVATAGGAGTDYGLSVATDASGNVYVTGYFEGQVTFGGAPLDSAGGADAFVASFDVSGGHRWSARYGAAGEDKGAHLALDGDGNVIVTGSFESTVGFGGAALTSAGGADVFVASYDGSGAHRWSRRAGGLGADGGADVAADGAGRAFVIGSFEQTADFGGGAKTSAGDADIFLASYDGAGSHVWSRTFGAANYDSGNGVAVDAAGNVYATGSAWLTSDFGGGALTSTGRDIFLASYDSAGVHRWSRRFGGDGSSGYGIGMVVAPGGNVYLVGHFQQTVDFGGGPLRSSYGIDTDIFLASYDASGAHRWSQRFGASGWDYAGGIALDARGNVVITGGFLGTVDFGGGPMTSAGSADIVVASYDAAGVHRWSRSFGGTGADRGQEIVLRQDGDLLVTGHFQQTVDFGGGVQTCAGAYDVFVLTLTP